ncbi:V-Type Proton Atpase Subunit G 1 [Manis pentadactyla]|nr:V-Type Proton Atpase Subunit G 1 [Manis pentadactyla]
MVSIRIRHQDEINNKHTDDGDGKTCPSGLMTQLDTLNIATGVKYGSQSADGETEAYSSVRLQSHRRHSQSAAGQSVAAAGGGEGHPEGVQVPQAEEPETEGGQSSSVQRETEFKAKEAAALGSHGGCGTEHEKETQEKRTALQTYFPRSRDEVLDDLLAFVCNIRPEIHEIHHNNG